MAPRLAAAIAITLAVALAWPAVAATPKAGSWSGSTRQGKSITFKVTPGGAKVKNIRFGFRGRCENGATTSGTAYMPGPFKVVNGEFTARGGANIVRGTFTSRTRARGRLRQRGTLYDPITFRSVPCTSGRVRWGARR